MLQAGDLEFSKIAIFVVVMASSINHQSSVNQSFCCRYPGDKKIINFYDAEIKLHIFSCEIKSVEDVFFL